VTDHATCYVEGRWCAPEDARVSLFDSGLMYGDTVTETLRTFDGRPYELERHLERMRRSLRLARIELEPEVDLAGLVGECARRGMEAFADDGEVLVKLDVTRGVFDYYRRPGVEYASSHVLLHALPVPFWRFHRSYETGIAVAFPTTRQVPSATLDTRIKHRSRMYQAIAEREAADVDPGAAALLLDMDGRVAEGTGWNVFAVRDGRVVTPALDNCLEGVSRSVALELCGELGLDVGEGTLRPYDLQIADELFATATSYCVVPITRVQGRTAGGGRRGPVTTRLTEAWGRRVGLDFVAQARERAAAQLRGREVAAR
jgi:branched-chain amino acid aminotransferase